MKNTILILIFLLIPLISCQNSEVLSPEPSVFDLDATAPACPGLTSVSVSSGPSLSLQWAQGTDLVSEASKITYSVFMRKNAESYDLNSPSKVVIGATSTLVSNGISVGQTYTLFVQCKDEAGNSYPTGPTNEQSITVDDSQAPSQITDLAASNPTYTSILLTWSPSDDGAGGTGASAMQYRVYGSTTSPVSTSGSSLATTTGTTSYLHSGLNPNQTWYYRVVALDSVANVSADSNQASNTTVADSTVPAFAGNTFLGSVTSASTTGVDFSWTAASDNVTATAALTYRVYRCSGSTTCDPYAAASIFTTAAGATSYSDSGLVASTVYVYGIRAADSSNNLSTNTDKLITSTTYSSSGSFYAYPTAPEMNIYFGRAVAVANVLGDASGASAFPDLIVGAPNASEGGSAYQNTGCIFVFQGTAVGVFDTIPTDVLCQPGATGNGGNARNFGYALSTADIEGDGDEDLIVASPQQNKVFIVRTTNTGGVLSLGTVSTIAGGATTTFGMGVCTGDSDGVGQPDIFIVDPAENCDGGCGGITATGNVHIYTNTSSGGSFSLPSLHGTKISPTSTLTGLGASISNSEYVAKSCAFGKFDPNNATQDQLVIGSGTVSWGAGAATDGIVMFYRKTGANTFTFQNVLRADTLLGLTTYLWGEAITGIQLDSGTKELIVGSPNNSSVGTNGGAAYSYTVTTAASDFSLTDTGETYYGGTDYNSNGAGSGLFAYDIWNHGDGKQDFVLGASVDDNTNTAGATNIDLGEVFTYKNTAGVLASTIQQTNFDPTDLNARTDQRFGFGMCRGDVNNDGYQDVMIGAPLVDYDPITEQRTVDLGAINIYYGAAAGEIDFENPSHTLYSPGGVGYSYFGSSCVVLDYDGDGMQDLAVGAYNRTVSVSNRGAVYVYYGSSNADLPDGNSATLNMPGVATAGTRFGYALSKGDLDNNGYDDLIVSALTALPTAGFTNSVGRVFVFWADTTTHAISPGNYTSLQPPKGAYATGQNTYLTNTQTTDKANFNFGMSLAVFPTVSGSSGKDLIVCSDVHDYAASDVYAGHVAMTVVGNCYIYEGRVNGGLGADYQMMTMPKNEIRYPYASTGYFGTYQYFGSSMTIGKWNNDNVDDLVICARYHRKVDDGINNAGGCLAFYGKSDGTGGFESYNSYRANAAGARNIPIADSYHYNPNTTQTSTEFGKSVLLLDINNNAGAGGTPNQDLMVGEQLSHNMSGPENLGYYSGRVYIIRGSFSP